MNLYGLGNSISDPVRSTSERRDFFFKNILNLTFG